jgi:WD40 repeat protein
LINLGYKLINSKNKGMRMKKALILTWFLLLYLSNIGLSQSLSFYDLNIDDYPEIKAKFYALDVNGNTIPNISSTDFEITENGEMREILEVSCPAVKPPDAISSVLTIDISGSMSRDGLNYAKAAAKAWIEVLPLGKSECALTTFNSSNFLNMDFTTERSKLKDAIEQLKAGGGTDFDAGLLNPMAGALLISEKAKHKRVIVFLTDGHASGNEQKIIKKANDLDAVIFSVVLGNPCPEILKNISKQTGGDYFEKITTEEEAKEVYLNILQMAQGGEPCTIKWHSDGCDLKRNVEIKLLPYSLTASLSYDVPKSNLSILEISPANSIKFGGVEPEKTGRIIITMKAINKDINIKSIKSSNKLFKLSNYSGSAFKIEAGKSFDFFLDFLPVDSNYAFSRFQIESDACFGNFFYASGGFPYSGIGDKTLKITRPNGGEYFPAGGIEKVTWEGVLPIDTIKLEYSIDEGQSWTTITEEAADLVYDWKVPNTPSDICLMKATQFTPAETRSQVIDGKMENVEAISWEPNGERIIYHGIDRAMKIVRVSNGEILHTIGTYLHYTDVVWNPINNSIAAAQSDYLIRILDPETGNFTKNIGYHEKWIPALSWHPNGTNLASGSNDNKIKLWETVNSQLVREIDAGGEVLDLEWNYDGSLLASASTTKNIKIWDAFNGVLLKTLAGHTNSVTSISWSPFGNRLVSGSKDSTIKIWDVETEEVIYDINTGSVVNDVVWSLDGFQIAVALQDRSIGIWDPETGNKINTLYGHTAGVTTLAWRPDGMRLASGSNDNSIRIWYFDYFMQEDESDSLWTITLPVASAKDVDMGTVRVGSMRDSVVSSYINNIGNVNVQIDTITIVGNDADEFELASGIPPYDILSGENQDVEFRFKPSSIGTKQAEIHVFSQNDTLIHQISGLSVEPDLRLLTEYIDFGRVGVTFSKDSLCLLLENIGTEAVLVTDTKIEGPDTASFILLDDISSFTIEPGEKKDILIRFLPLDSGRTNTQLTFYYNDDTSPVSAQLFGEGFTICGPGSFYYPDFKYLKDLNLVSRARNRNNMIMLTPSEGDEKGALWHNKLVPVREGFVMDFSFIMTEGNVGNSQEGSLPGADGLAFVIQNSTPDTIGFSGGGIGYENISNSLAVEFDTFANDSLQIEDYKDPNGNHVAVQSLGPLKISARHSPENTLAINSDIMILRSDSTKYYVKIDYKQEDESFRVFLDTIEITEDAIPVINIENFDLSELLNLTGGNRAYIGLTAATGSAWEKHYIVDWKYCPDYDIHFVSVPYTPEITESKKDLSVYPNPGKDKFYIDFFNHDINFVDLRIYDMYGREIDVIVRDILSSGSHKIEWIPDGLSEGIYFCQLKVDSRTESVKIMIIK